MDRTELDRLREEAAQRHSKRVAESEEELKRDTDAIDRVAMLAKCPKQDDHAEARAFAKGDLSRLVFDAVADSKKPTFSAIDIEKSIRSMHPEINGNLSGKAVATVLRRFAENKNLVLHEEGRGRKPATYSRP